MVANKYVEWRNNLKEDYDSWYVHKTFQPQTRMQGGEVGAQTLSAFMHCVNPIDVHSLRYRAAWLAAVIAE